MQSLATNQLNKLVYPYIIRLKLPSLLAVTWETGCLETSGSKTFAPSYFLPAAYTRSIQHLANKGAPAITDSFHQYINPHHVLSLQRPYNDMSLSKHWKMTRYNVSVHIILRGL